MPQKKPVSTEWMCTWCGQRSVKSALGGRPSPGTCSKRSTAHQKKPHVWVKNRSF